MMGATTGLLFPARALRGDIVKGLPVPDGMCTGVFSSHVLEHIPRNDLPVALRNTARMLRRGGVFRLVVPDLRWRAERYVRSAENDGSDAADNFMKACILGQMAKSRSPLALLRNRFGNSAHLWMYDFASLRGLLLSAGFQSIRRCEFGDASDPMFSRVEQPGRFVDGEQHELAIEAVIPI
jgi:predicted SAM-dependent methyltransferase